jgi:hypothetical protein
MAFLYTHDNIRSMRIAAIKLMPKESDYVVTVPQKERNGVSERVAYGLSLQLSKRAAGQLARAVQSFYPHGKPRAIMLKTAVKSGLFA